MKRKPFIGINMDYRSAKKDSPALALVLAGYFDCIVRAGGVPVIVPPMEDEDDIEQLMDMLDGFVLVGGADLDPRRDGFMLHPSVRPMDRRREDFDRTLMKMIAERRMPLFAIGVGMQLLNVSQSGNLHLHIPEDVPNALPHKEINDPAHRHTLLITPGTLLDRVYGDGEIRVNSMHHMAVDEVAAGFIVSARCPDGVIEAIESEMLDWFVIGTQFHPEADTASAVDIRIFEEFVDAIRVRTGAQPQLAILEDAA